MKPSKTWVLIADGARARLVVAAAHGKHVDVVEKAEFSTGHAASHDIGRDSPPRVHESLGATRHAIEPKSDPHRELKRDFAETLAQALDDIVTKEHIDSLVIAAAPVTLGDLRKALSERVKKIVFAEVAMDLTKVPNDELGEHIRHLMPL
jgi:protein required for attachment to host cells